MHLKTGSFECSQPMGKRNRSNVKELSNGCVAAFRRMKIV